MFPGSQTLFPGNQTLFNSNQTLFTWYQTLFTGHQTLFPGYQTLFPKYQTFFSFVVAVAVGDCDVHETKMEDDVEFVELVKKLFYDGLKYHTVINLLKKFMGVDISVRTLKRYFWKLNLRRRGLNYAGTYWHALANTSISLSHSDSEGKCGSSST